MTIVEHALGWLGTPYRHQAALKGIGCDCLGLVRGIHASVVGTLPSVAPYTQDWAESESGEALIEGLSDYLWPITPDTAAPGDVLVFRLRAHVAAKHLAILTSPTEMVHAQQGATVSLVAFSPWWRRHLAAAFRFPTSD